MGEFCRKQTETTRFLDALHERGWNVYLSDPPSPPRNVLVDDVPGKPGTPEVAETGADSARLDWKAPDSDGGSPVTNYVVEMRLAGETKWKVVSKDEKVVETSFTVKGLKWTKEHEFRVTAENKAGPGPASAPSQAAEYGKLFYYSTVLQSAEDHQLLSAQFLTVPALCPSTPLGEFQPVCSLTSCRFQTRNYRLQRRRCLIANFQAY